MHIHSEHLRLSPSDVTAFLACEHLTTLSLAHARGELDRPEVENEQAELIFRKGLEHERAYLEHLRADGKTVLEIPDPRGDYDGAARATADAIRDGEADVIYQGVFAHEHWRGVADFLLRRPDGVYEALDTKLARSAKPAYILQLLFYSEQLARIQGPADRKIHVLLGSGEQATFDPREFAAYYRRVRSRLEQFVADPPPTEPYPVHHCDVCDFKAVCDAWWDEVDHLTPRRRRLPDADREARGRRDHDARPARPRARGARAGRDQPGHVGEEPRAGRAAAARARDRRGHLPAAAAAGGSRLRAPARALAWRPLLRLRGQPVLGQGRLARVPLGDPRRRRQLHAAARARPRHRAAGVRAVHRPRPRAPARVPRPARLPLRRLRDHRAEAADGPLRHARGRARRPAPPRRLRRSAQGRPQRPPHLAAGLRAEGDGGVPRLRAAGRGEGRRHLDRDLRAVDADRRAGAARPDRRVQPRGLHRDASAARLAARAEAAGRADRARAAAARAEAGAGGEAGAGRAARGAARGGGGAGGAAARLPRPRAQAGLVGVLRPDGAGRPRSCSTTRRRSAASSRTASPSASTAPGRTRSSSRRRSTSSAWASRRPIVQPGSRRARSPSSTASRGGSCSSAAARSRTCRCRRRSFRRPRSTRRSRRRR